MTRIYDLRANSQYIKNVQNASLYNEDLALKITHGLFGSDEWWANIDSGILQKRTLKGTISRVYMSGMNDWPEFEIVTTDGEKSQWTREVDEKSLDSMYRSGAAVEIDYVIQTFKRDFGTGPDSRFVLEIRVED